MRLCQIISADKEIQSTGTWGSGKMARSDWPSRTAKAKAYKFGTAYTWRIIKFTCKGLDCRVRVLFNEDKSIFRATFGVTISGDTTVLCDYEWHGSEPGWHCHARCDEVNDLDPSKNRFGSRRLPAAGTFHRRMEFGSVHGPMDEETAFNTALSVFRIKPSGTLL